jgi:hypothetical protein
MASFCLVSIDKTMISMVDVRTGCSPALFVFVDKMSQPQRLI